LVCKCMQPATSVSASEYEHVYLVSEELEDVEPTTFQAELEQQGSRQRKRVVIFNGTYLGVHMSAAVAGPRSYWLNLTFLDPKPVRQTDRVWLGVAAGAAVLSLGAGLAYTFVQLSPVWAVALALLPAAALLSLGIALYRSFGTLVYCTRHGRVPVLRLIRGQPDRHRLKGFLEELQHAVRRALAERSGVRGDYLRDEMKEHRRLLAQGVLGAQQYEVAQALILRAHG